MEAAKIELIQPNYCEYASGPCNQDLSITGSGEEILVLYASEPREIATTIESATKKLRGNPGVEGARTWRDLKIGGQTIFCEIDKAMRSASLLVADITTLNFNLMFEIGFGIGIGRPIILIRDTTYVRDERAFRSLGLLDTLGYIDFQNSEQLVGDIVANRDGAPIPIHQTRKYTESPLYLLTGPHKTDGVLQLTSTLEKSRIKVRAYDPVETPRIALHELIRQVYGSVGVVAHLHSSNREGSTEHNALVALTAGLAMALEKVVLILDNTDDHRPIDYRDVVLKYRDPNQIPRILNDGLNRVLDFVQTGSYATPVAHSVGILKDLDWGDLAAENEISGLSAYFLETGQYLQARQGHARLVTGRKGSGKTAIFFEIRKDETRGQQSLVVDLRPEGHQFTRLRECLAETMSLGTQEHTYVAFWNYLLLTEIARKALEVDRQISTRDPVVYERYKRLEELYERHDPGKDSDFAQRLARQVERVAAKLERFSDAEKPGQITQIIYEGDLVEFASEIANYLSLRESVCLLVDNLDKGWPVGGSNEIDILITRSLLEATRKIQRMLEGRSITFKCLVFLRSDIFEHLQKETPDKGKDTAIKLDWEDSAQFEQLVALRIESSTGIVGDFRSLWSKVCVPLVKTQDSFGYIIDRTLMRPRDLLRFLHTAVDIAINRGHERILEDDVIQAEKSFSQDLIVELGFEIADTYPQFGDAVFAFQEAGRSFSQEEAILTLMVSGIENETDAKAAVDLLIWFGFLGVVTLGSSEAKFSYDAHGNMRRILFPLEHQNATLTIHPAFRSALNVQP